MSDSPAPSLTRRVLLRTGIAGLGLAILGTGLSFQSSKLRRAPSQPLRVFDLTEYSILAAVAERLCPSPRPGVPGAAAVDVAGLADAALFRADDEAKKGLKLALAILENGAVGALFGERVRPFTQLAPEDQDRILLAFRDSKVAVRRAIFRGLSGLTASMYYGEESTWAGCGYPGPPDPVGLRTAYAAQLVDLDSLVAPGGR